VVLLLAAMSPLSEGINTLCGECCGNVVSDPLDRTNLKDRQPEVYRRLVAEYDAWNRTMLPENPSSYSEKINGKQWADHYGSQPD
jgi:hypothetical protein